MFHVEHWHGFRSPSRLSAALRGGGPARQDFLKSNPRNKKNPIVPRGTLARVSVPSVF
jgi:hypothetical protein